MHGYFILFLVDYVWIYATQWHELLFNELRSLVFDLVRVTKSHF